MSVPRRSFLGTLVSQIRKNNCRFGLGFLLVKMGSKLPFSAPAYQIGTESGGQGRLSGRRELSFRLHQCLIQQILLRKCAVSCRTEDHLRMPMVQSNRFRDPSGIPPTCAGRHRPDGPKANHALTFNSVHSSGTAQDQPPHIGHQRCLAGPSLAERVAVWRPPTQV